MTTIIDFATRQAHEAPEFWKTRRMIESFPPEAAEETFDNIAVACMTAFEEEGQMRWSIDGIVPREVAQQIIELCIRHNQEQALPS